MGNALRCDKYWSQTNNDSINSYHPWPKENILTICLHRVFICGKNVYHIFYFCATVVFCTMTRFVYKFVRKHQSDSEEFKFFNKHSGSQNRADIAEYYISMKCLNFQKLEPSYYNQIGSDSKYFLFFEQRLFCLFVFVIYL